MKFILTILLFFMFGFTSVLLSQNKENTKKTTETKKKVIFIYGSADCHYCIDAKNILIEKKIDFIFYDIDTDKVALNEMLTKLQHAKISTQNLGIPVVDKYGELFLNNTTFDDFLKKLIP